MTTTSLRLEHIYQEAQGIEENYHSILFIPSESYDAPAVTLIEGLSSLGIRIYTIEKPNINSWFTNEMVGDPRAIDFDFTLSNLHWGTRFSYYDKYDLHGYKKVFLDGSDTVGTLGWRGKHEAYSNRYISNSPEKVKKMRLSPYRWMEPIGNYEPDIVFTSQKISDEGYYFPFGIQQVNSSWFEDKSFNQRKIDFAHIPGVGSKRKEMRDFLRENQLSGNVHNEGVYGTPMTPDPIRELVAVDMKVNVHSYHRWVFREDYFKLLNNTKALIYPGVKPLQWDSKRPWEAVANGCLVLYEIDIDASEYPIQELCPFAEYHEFEELVDKAEFLYNNPDFFEEQRQMFYTRAMRYFNSEALARYFLWRLS